MRSLGRDPLDNNKNNNKPLRYRYLDSGSFRSFVLLGEIVTMGNCYQFTPPWVPRTIVNVTASLCHFCSYSFSIIIFLSYALSDRPTQVCQITFMSRNDRRQCV